MSQKILCKWDPEVIYIPREERQVRARRFLGGEEETKPRWVGSYLGQSLQLNQVGLAL